MRPRLLVALLLFAGRVSALEFAAHSPQTLDFPLTGHVHYYFEEYNEQQPHEALELLRAGQFQRANSAVLSLGYTSKAVWVAIPVAAEAADGQRLILEIAALVDNIEFHYLDELGIRLSSLTTGADFPLTSRPLRHNYFLFPFSPLRPKTTGKIDKATLARVRIDDRLQITEDTTRRGVILVRLRCQGRLLLPLRLAYESTFYRVDRVDLFVFGAYCGVLLVMLLWHLFFYWSGRDRVHAFFFLYALFLLLHQLALRGFVHELLLPGYPRLSKYLQPGFLCLATLFQLRFAAQFFQTGNAITRLHRLSGYLSLASLLSLLAGAFMPYRYFSGLALTVAAAAVLVVLVEAMLLNWKKTRSALFFLLAFTVLVFGIALQELRNAGYLGETFIGAYATVIGSALQMILLSLALRGQNQTA